MPIWVLVVDELGDLLAVAPRATEELLVRFAALGRAVGLHLILAMQRPSVNVVASVLKANIPARLACRLPSASDSRMVFDQAGAEDLLGPGDALFLAQDGTLTQAALSALRLAQSPAHVRAIEALVLFVDRDRRRVFEAVNLVENRLPRRVNVARIRDNPVLTIERAGALVPAPVGTVFHRRVSFVAR